MESGQKVYKFKVEMTCEGCSGAVSKVLTREKEKGTPIQTFDIDLENKLVTVTSGLTSNEVLAIIQKTGKQTTLLGEN